MKTKLIIVEGLPGSGKSTTAQMIYDILKRKDIDVELYSEGNYNHPADFDGVSYFNSEDFDKLLKNYPANVELLNKMKVSYCNGYIIPYRKAIEEQHISFEENFLNEITKNDIYELPVDIHVELILKRWTDFVRNHINQDKVIIFECCFIQNPVTITMIKNNLTKEFTINYINNLNQIIMPLYPILIYAEQNDIKSSFNKAVKERPKEWFEGFTNYYTSQGFGLANNLKGLEGVIKILEARNKLEIDIYNSLNLIKYKINNSAFDADLLKHNVKSIIDTNAQIL